MSHLDQMSKNKKNKKKNKKNKKNNFFSLPRTTRLANALAVKNSSNNFKNPVEISESNISLVFWDKEETFLLNLISIQMFLWKSRYR